MDEGSRPYIREFRNESGRSMLHFVFSDESRLIGYQLEMIRNNRIPLLLKSEVLKVDGEVRISFDITSMIPLKKILERKEIGKREFVSYMRQIAEAFDHLDNHLLDYGGLLLDSGVIFGSPSDDRIFFVYLPLRDAQEDIGETLRQFITNLIIREMKFRNEVSDNYIQRLIEELKSPDFSLASLKSWLNLFGQCRAAEREEPQVSGADREAAARINRDFSEQPEKENGPKTSSQGTYAAGTVIKKGYPLSSWITLGAAVAAVLALFAAVYAKGALKPGNPDMLTTLAGLVLISSAAIWLVWSKAFPEEKKIQRKIEKTGARKIDTAGSTAGPVHAARPKPPKKVEYVNKSIMQPANEALGGEESKGLDEAAADRTILLYNKSAGSPRLKRLADGEMVIIGRWPFRIGRMAEQVDYCIKNPAVGRIHAELSKATEGYFITDMNTRNGTYVNGVRIEPNTEHPVKSGDRIMLANEEFQFFE